MQQSTIFSILLILLTKRRVSRKYLSERFSVSTRTVSRYIAVLEDVGVPIITLAGRGGGFSLADDYTIDKSFLSEAEALRIKDALFRTAESYADGINAAITDKLDNIDKMRERDSYVVKQENLYIDCEQEQAEKIKPRIKVLSEAIEQQRSTEIKYADAHGYVSYREIEPYTLVLKSGFWYVYAMCKLRGDFRLFKLSRIIDVRKTSRRFVKTESRLTEKLELEYYNELYVDLEFEFYPTVRAAVTDWLGVDAVIERGTKLVAFSTVPFTDSLVKRLLSFGSSIKVINPPELETQMREEAKRMASMYDEK